MILNTMLGLVKRFGKVVVCGAVSGMPVLQAPHDENADKGRVSRQGARAEQLEGGHLQSHHHQRYFPPNFCEEGY